MSGKQRDAIDADEGTTRAWLAVARAYHHCGEAMARRLATIGIRLGEHEILVLLRREPGQSQQSLAARCFTAKSHISGLVTALEQRGWVRREADPADARARRLFLEPAGARMADRSAAVQADVVALMCRGLSPADLRRLQATMDGASALLLAALDEASNGRRTGVAGQPMQRQTRPPETR